MRATTVVLDQAGSKQLALRAAHDYEDIDEYLRNATTQQLAQLEKPLTSVRSQPFVNAKLWWSEVRRLQRLHF